MNRKPAASLAIAVLVGAGRLAPANAAQELTVADPAKPRIEVAFVLDTTGSMSGLINAAKEKIWAIANNLANTKPAPHIKMGLVGYRDRGDAYITRVTDLTDNLDAVYSELMGFRAGGGGDGPESVNQALHEALTKLTWSSDESTYRVAYLVGDAPPHMDYAQDVKYPETCSLAAHKDVIINTIQCGSNGGATPVWQDVARRAEGRYFRVEQSGAAILASTPFDAEIAKLSQELDGTRIHYGAGKAAAAQAEKLDRERGIYEKASESALARRGIFNAAEAGAENFLGKNELVDAVARGEADVADIKAEELPAPMRKMSVSERQAYVARMQKRRAELQSQIAALATERQAHIEAEVKKRVGGAKDSLDAALYQTIKEQAAKKKIAYGDAMSY